MNRCALDCFENFLNSFAHNAFKVFLETHRGYNIHRLRKGKFS